jgi:hypothetical protein
MTPPDPQPPQPPPFQRRIQISAAQLAGIALLLVLPVAALSGLLGTKKREVRASAGALELSARYPSRMHYKTSGSLELRLKNTGAGAIGSATLRLGDSYLQHFADAQFQPQVQRLNEEGVEIDLGELAPGQTRRLRVELRAEDYGTHDGQVSASAQGLPPVALEVSTLVLP